MRFHSGTLFGATTLVSQKVVMRSFGKSQYSRKSVNLFFILVMIKDKLTFLGAN